MPIKRSTLPRHLAMPRAILALMLREMTGTYGSSAGGYFWLVAEPVLSISLLTLVFSFAFHAPALGTNFPVFYATGVLPYLTYMLMGRRVGTAIAYSRPLLAYPGMCFIDAILARAALTMMTQVVVFYLVIAGIEAAFATHTVHDYRHMVGSFAMAGALGLGIGTFNCFLWSLFPDWERIWGILNKPLFLVSAILFTVEDLPAGWQGWIWFNPLVHVTAEMRRGFYPAYEGSFISYAYVLAVAMTGMVAGLFLLVSHQKRLLA